ncbi:hypothetical protein [Pontibacter beigongshangensis]|uniref:hypothetical protein n=1 Tax=Pontibacter beigongshangensis TaxID=2574733 RepID=UPI00165015D1|nr:hypothetical protein [Pontibacter beigongshangensis]
MSKRPALFFLIILFLMIAGGSAAQARQEKLEHKFPQAAAAVVPLTKEFPLLAQLLQVQEPWQGNPLLLKDTIFPKELRLAQGTEKYPLLYTAQRNATWPGLPVFGQLAYEVEYYVFDLTRPVIKIHIGRPLRFDMQHGRVEALAASKKGKSIFPYLDESMKQPLFENISQVVKALAPYGAKELPFNHPKIKKYLLPEGIVLTVSDYSGSTNGTVYIQLTLEPEQPIRAMQEKHIPAFPGAEGYGCYTPGGRGGKVFVVTTLEDYLPEDRPGREEGLYGQPSEFAKTLGKGNWIPYVDALGQQHPEQARPKLPGYPMIPKEKPIAGSLREAIEAEGPRIIVFAVTGTIELKAPLTIMHPYLTVAGNTAPGAGIQLKNWGIDVRAHDVVLRYLRIRVGETKGPGKLQRVLGDQTHGLDIRAMNVVVDHCEAAFANDQIFNIYGAEKRVASTVQWSYIYGAPRKSTHEKGNHSMSAAANGWGYISFHHNLIAHGERRNIRAEMLSLDYRNNILYNYGGAGYGSPNDYIRLNYIGNVQQEGPDSQRLRPWKWGFQSESVYARFYAINNKMPADGPSDLKVLSETLMSEPFKAYPVTTDTPELAYQKVLQSGGANLPVRDIITRYVAKTVLEGIGTIPGNPADWPGGGFATYPKAKAPRDSDWDGMPDEWELQYGLNPHSAADATQDKDGDGYTNIEEYINATTPVK